MSRFARIYRRHKRRLTEAYLLVGAFVLLAGGAFLQNAYTRPGDNPPDSREANRIARQDLDNDFIQFAPEIRRFTDKENANGITVVDDLVLQQKITGLRFDTANGRLQAARSELDQLKDDMKGYEKQLDEAIAKRAAAAAELARKANAPPPPKPSGPTGLVVPIILYHYTPGDFENQLQYLIAHGYNTITPDQLTAAINGHFALPRKPIILTFDDGFANQLQAFALLKKYQLRATFYIIAGGPGSNYCIGANRTNTTCGDAYLTWDQIVMLDQSGLITIGGHTVDHPNLPSLNVDTQRYEIADGKKQIEDHLGHPITTFAYPYGAYNATTISLVQQAGFTSAVTTLPGTVQSPGRLFTLYRARVVYALP